MSFLSAAIGAELLAAFLAIVLAERRREHRPAAVALVLLAVSAVANLPILAALRPLPRPVEGCGRVYIYLDGALRFAPMAIVPGLAVAVCLERSRRAVACVVAAWALASIGLALAYPSAHVRGDDLARLYLMANLAGLFVAVAALGRWTGLRRAPTSAHVIVLALVAADFAILLARYSPWRDGLFGQYEGVQLMLVVLFVVLALYQGVLCRSYPMR